MLPCSLIDEETLLAVLDEVLCIDNDVACEA